MLAGASKPQQGIVATVLGIGLLLFAAVGVVVQLKDALNTVWEVVARKKGAYLVSLAGVLALGFLLLVSLLLSTALSASGKYLSPHLATHCRIEARLGRMATANDEEERDTILTAGLPATCITAGHSYVEQRSKLCGVLHVEQQQTLKIPREAGFQQDRRAKWPDEDRRLQSPAVYHPEACGNAAALRSSA
jgi:hypothetical protein